MLIYKLLLQHMFLIIQKCQIIAILFRIYDMVGSKKVQEAREIKATAKELTFFDCVIRCKLTPILNFNNFSNKMKRKYESQQTGIRVKNLQASKKAPPLQYCQQSTILSDPFSLTLNSNTLVKNQPTSALSQSLSMDLISQIQKLNEQVNTIRTVMKEKQNYIHKLQNKCKSLQQEKRKSQIEMKTIISEKNKELKRKNEELQKKNVQIQKYQAEIKAHVEDVKVQNKQMMNQLIRELDIHRQRQYKETTQVLQEHQRTLRSIEQNSFLQRQQMISQQNLVLQKQDQNSINTKQDQNSINTKQDQNSIHVKFDRVSPLHRKVSPENPFDKSPRSKRAKIQKPSSERFKTLTQIIKMNDGMGAQKSYGMLSPLTVNIDSLEHSEISKPRPKYLRAEELQYISFY